MKKQLPLIGIIIATVFGIALIDQMAGKWDAVDLKVYYEAGKRMVSHEQLYRVAADGHYVYKYSPIFAAILSPFCIFNFIYFKLIYLLSLGLLYFFMISKLQEAFFHSSIKGNFALVILIIVFIKHIQKEIHLGQVNMLLTALLYCTLHYSASKPKMGAGLFVFSLFIKPIGLIFLPLFLIQKECELLLWSAIFSAIAIFFSLLMMADAHSFLINYSGWMYELKGEIMSKTNLASIDTQTVAAGVFRITHLASSISFLIAISITGYLLYRANRSHSKEFYLFLLGSIPLIVCTSNNFYVLAMPLFYFAFSQYTEMKRLSKCLLIISCFLMVINQYEIWGRNGVDQIEYYAPYAFSIWLIMITLESDKVFSHVNKSI